MKKIAKNKRSNQGITLIALIITVIVMLILAGVAINMTIGDNGIFKKTADSADISKRENAREKLNLVLMDVQMRRIKEGESLALSEGMASEIEGYKDITSAKFTGTKIETVVDGYNFVVNGDLGIDFKKEIAKVEPENLSDWEYRIESDGTATLLTYKGSATKVVVPNYIEGYWVKQVGEDKEESTSRTEKYCIWSEDICVETQEYSYTKYNQETITEIVVSEGIDIIGSKCFEYSKALKNITIPNTVTGIKAGTFKNCSNLTEIDIPNSVTKIEDAAFTDCASLTKVTIPNSVTKIGNSAFAGCSALTEITIPNSVSEMGIHTFTNCTSLTKATISNSVSRLAYATFMNCSSLTEIDIPNSVSEIGDYAFADCTSLAKVTIPNSVSKIGSEGFANCTSLTKVTIPNAVTEIGAGVFSNCTNLTIIEVPFKEGEMPSDWTPYWNSGCQAQIIYQQ